MVRRVVIALVTIVAATVSLGGCAAIGIPLLLMGAGTAAGTGVSYTLDSIAYKTFTAPLPGLESAVLLTMKRMDIGIAENTANDAGKRITGKAGDRDIEIELDRLTSRTTRMRVVAKKPWLLRDRATATEVILQTDQTLSDNPHFAALDPRPPASSQRARAK